MSLLRHVGYVTPFLFLLVIACSDVFHEVDAFSSLRAGPNILKNGYGWARQPGDGTTRLTNVGEQTPRLVI